jgi:hypoxanthine phosphoribosyltransferase
MKVHITEEQLRSGIARMADQIRQHYAGRPLTLVGVMTGSIMLMADLVRLLDMPIRVELILARKPVKGTDRPGPLVFDPEVLMTDVKGRDVLLVDDLFATGQTLWELIPQMDDLGPTSVRSAVLLRKQTSKQVSMQPDFVAFDIPDVFVVGYGLDYNDRYRNLPHIAELEPKERGEG